MGIEFTVIGVFASLFGLSFFSVAVVLGLRKRAKIKRSATTTGIVVDNATSLGMHQNIGTPRSTLYKPTVRFQTADGRVVDYTPQVSNSWSSYRVGETVPVYYNPQQPGDAVVGTAFGLWYGFFVFGAVGGMFFLFGIFFVLLSQIENVLWLIFR